MGEKNPDGVKCDFEKVTKEEEGVFGDAKKSERGVS